MWQYKGPRRTLVTRAQDCQLLSEEERVLLQEAKSTHANDARTQRIEGSDKGDY